MSSRIGDDRSIGRPRVGHERSRRRDGAACRCSIRLAGCMLSSCSSSRSSCSSRCRSLFPPIEPILPRQLSARASFHDARVSQRRLRLERRVLRRRRQTDRSSSGSGCVKRGGIECGELARVQTVPRRNGGGSSGQHGLSGGSLWRQHRRARGVGSHDGCDGGGELIGGRSGGEQIVLTRRRRRCVRVAGIGCGAPHCSHSQARSQSEGSRLVRGSRGPRGEGQRLFRLGGHQRRAQSCCGGALHGPRHGQRGQHRGGASAARTGAGHGAGRGAACGGRCGGGGGGGVGRGGCGAGGRAQRRGRDQLLHERVVPFRTTQHRKANARVSVKGEGRCACVVCVSTHSS